MRFSRELSPCCPRICCAAPSGSGRPAAPHGPVVQQSLSSFPPRWPRACGPPPRGTSPQGQRLWGERDTASWGHGAGVCRGGGCGAGWGGEGQSPQRPLLELRVDPVVERIETHPCDRHSPAPPRAGRGSPPPQNPWDPALEFLTAVRSLENVQEASRVTGSEAAEGAGLWSLRVFAHVCLGGKWPRGRQPGTAPPYVITWGAVGSPALWDRGASESPGLSHLQAAEGR